MAAFAKRPLDGMRLPRQRTAATRGTVTRFEVAAYVAEHVNVRLDRATLAAGSFGLALECRDAQRPLVAKVPPRLGELRTATVLKVSQTVALRFDDGEIDPAAPTDALRDVKQLLPEQEGRTDEDEAVLASPVCARDRVRARKPSPWARHLAAGTQLSSVDGAPCAGYSEEDCAQLVHSLAAGATRLLRFSKVDGSPVAAVFVVASCADVVEGAAAAVAPKAAGAFIAEGFLSKDTDWGRKYRGRTEAETHVAREMIERLLTDLERTDEREQLANAATMVLCGVTDKLVRTRIPRCFTASDATEQAACRDLAATDVRRCVADLNTLLAALDSLAEAEADAVTRGSALVETASLLGVRSRFSQDPSCFGGPFLD